MDLSIILTQHNTDRLRDLICFNESQQDIKMIQLKMKKKIIVGEPQRTQIAYKIELNRTKTKHFRIA